MLIDRYPPEDVFARIPELADQTDPVLVELDRLLEDDRLYLQVRGDLARRYPRTPVHGRHSTPAEVLLRLLVVQHLYAWSYAETVICTSSLNRALRNSSSSAMLIPSAIRRSSFGLLAFTQPMRIT